MCFLESQSLSQIRFTGNKVSNAFKYLLTIQSLFSFLNIHKLLLFASTLCAETLIISYFTIRGLVLATQSAFSPQGPVHNPYKHLRRFTFYSGCFADQIFFSSCLSVGSSSAQWGFSCESRGCG